MKPHIIIGVAGGTGSGKTTLARALQARLTPPGALLLHQDSYYHDFDACTEAEKERINFDDPASFDIPLLVQHIAALRSGHSVQQPVYDYATHSRAGYSETVPQPVIILEGILLLAIDDLRPLLDIPVFVSAPDDIRFMRRLARDMLERGRTRDSVYRQYLETVRPMHELYVEPSRRHARLIVPEGGQNTVALEAIASCALSMLNGAEPPSAGDHP
jgi:uridine kinase